MGLADSRSDANRTATTNATTRKAYEQLPIQDPLQLQPQLPTPPSLLRRSAVVPGYY